MQLLTENSNGFTLIELVIVIVLAGILALAGADLIVAPFKGFKETDARLELYEEGKLAVERMAAELRASIPNAVYVPAADSQTIEFGMIDVDIMRENGVFGRYLKDSNPTDNKIEDVNSSAPQGTLLSIYNQKWSGDFSNGDRIYRVENPGPPMELDSDIGFSGYLHKTRRFYVAKNQAVQYRLNGQTLERLTAQVTTSGVSDFDNPYPLAKHVTEAYFNYLPGNTKRNGIVTIKLVLESEAGENVTILQQVLLHNVP